MVRSRDWLGGSSIAKDKSTSGDSAFANRAARPGLRANQSRSAGAYLPVLIWNIDCYHI